MFMAEDQGYSRFFAQGKDDRLLFDLPAFGLHRRRSAGIAQASWTRHCTYSIRILISSIPSAAPPMPEKPITAA